MFVDRRSIVKLSSAMCLGCNCVTTYAAEWKEDTSMRDNDKMNVIFILTDDQGYGDLTCHGNKWMQTPNLDNLYERSARLTDFHSATTSAPTRSGLMTGHYNNTTGVWHTILGRSILDQEEVTIADIFAQAGYQTALFGKWHLGDNQSYRPNNRGFQETLYHGGGGVGQTPDYWNNTYFDDVYFRNGEPEQQVGYCTDIWFREAENFIKKNKDKPFLCFITPNAPHVPHIVAEKYAAPFRNNDNIPDPCFYGMIKNLDENVGNLMETIERLKIADHTIMIFMTDNGTAGGVNVDKNGFVTKGYNAGMRGKKGSVYEGGHRVPFFISGPGITPGDYHSLTNYVDILPTLIDICDIELKEQIAFDGFSLQSVFAGQPLENRIFCVDTQREEDLKKYKDYCVLYDKWRLINGTELYDITTDPGQKNNIAEANLQIVDKLKNEYEKWWKRNSVRQNEYQYIPLSPDYETLLTIHDAHSYDKQLPAWNQTSIREGVRSNGFWVVEIEEDGIYTFNLMRWAPETHTPLLSATPQGRAVQNAKVSPEGKKLDIIGGEISIGNNKQRKYIAEDFKGKAISFDIELKKGKYKLNADLIYADNQSFASFYVLVNKTNSK